MISWEFSYVTFWAVPCLRQLVVAYHPGDSSLFADQSVWDLWCIRWYWDIFFLRILRFFLSKCSFHERSIFIRLSFRGWTLGPLEDTVHPKNNKNYFWVIVMQLYCFLAIVPGFFQYMRRFESWFYSGIPVTIFFYWLLLHPLLDISPTFGSRV